MSWLDPPVSAVNISRKERERWGMLEYRAADVSCLLKILVTGRVVMDASAGPAGCISTTISTI